MWNEDEEWYESQKEHWFGWLREYDGPGAYGRKKHSGVTAKQIYNRIMCPPMLLWLGEASGVNRTKIISAKKACLKLRTFSSQCGAIRKHVPWDLVAAKLKMDREGLK